MINLRYLSSTEKKALNEYLNRLLSELQDKVLLVRLYGSKAKGTYHKESDIDLLIVMKHKPPSASRDSDLLAEIGLDILLKYNVVVSPVVYSQAEYTHFHNLQTNFMYWVDKEGKNIWQKSGLRI